MQFLEGGDPFFLTVAASLTLGESTAVYYAFSPGLGRLLLLNLHKTEVWAGRL